MELLNVLMFSFIMLQIEKQNCHLWHYSYLFSNDCIRLIYRLLVSKLASSIYYITSSKIYYLFVLNTLQINMNYIHYYLSVIFKFFSFEVGKHLWFHNLKCYLLNKFYLIFEKKFCYSISLNFTSTSSSLRSV